MIFVSVNKLNLDVKIYNLAAKFGKNNYSEEILPIKQLMMKENYHAFMADTFKAAVPNLKVIYSEVTRDYSELDKYKGKIWFHNTEEFKDKEKYRYIIGQNGAKRAVAIALRNRWRRHQLPDELKETLFNIGAQNETKSKL